MESVPLEKEVGVGGQKPCRQPPVSCTGIKTIDGQLDFFAVAVEGGGEILQETCEAQKWLAKRKGRETHPGGPFSQLNTAGHSQFDWSGAERDSGLAHSCGVSCGSAGQIE